jgi:hypothetical protein
MSAEAEVEFDFEIPEDPFDAFYFAVECILEEWQVLQVAVQNEWVVKAAEKKQELMNDILDLFEASKIQSKEREFVLTFLFLIRGIESESS